MSRESNGVPIGLLPSRFVELLVKQLQEPIQRGLLPPAYSRDAAAAPTCRLGDGALRQIVHGSTLPFGQLRTEGEHGRVREAPCQDARLVARAAWEDERRRLGAGERRAEEGGPDVGAELGTGSVARGASLVHQSCRMLSIRKSKRRSMTGGEAVGDRVKLTILLPKEDAHTLQELARRHGRTMTETVRRAIALENVVDDVAREDGKLLIRDKDNRDREVVLR